MNKEALETALNQVIHEARWEAVRVPGKTSALLKKGIVFDRRFLLTDHGARSARSRGSFLVRTVL
jgi:hypothetical protein